MINSFLWKTYPVIHEDIIDTLLFNLNTLFFLQNMYFLGKWIYYTQS